MWLNATSAPADVLLRWKFAQGQKLLVSLDQKIELDTTAGAQPRKLAIGMLMDMTWNVDAVAAEGTADITQTITRLKMHLETGHGPIDFDTDSDVPPKGAAEYFAAARS